MWADPRTGHPVDCDPLACRQCVSDDEFEVVCDALDCSDPLLPDDPMGVPTACGACDRCRDVGEPLPGQQTLDAEVA